MKKETKQNTNKMNLQKLVFHFLPLPALERVNVSGNFNSFLKEMLVLRRVGFTGVHFIETAL